MLYEWDVTKAHLNLRKHGIDFADAAAVFSDDYALTIPDDEIESEDRYVTIGMDALGRILVVVFVWRDETIRIISARKAERFERRQYEEQG